MIMTKKRTIKIVIIKLILLISSFVLHAQTELKHSDQAPHWVKQKPYNPEAYIGIGFAEKKKGFNHFEEAKKNALYDVTSEIKVNVSGTSMLYSTQKNNQYKENYEGLITLKNSDNIEGYELKGTYENETVYWVYYELNKEKYLAKKEKEKETAINNASILIQQAFEYEANNDFILSFKSKLTAFNYISAYIHEEVKFNANSYKISTPIDLCNLIQKQLSNITIKLATNAYVYLPFQDTYESLLYRVKTKSNTLQSFPFLLKPITQGLKINEQATTNDNGIIEIQIQKIENNQLEQVIELTPDLYTLSNKDSSMITGLKILTPFINPPTLQIYIKTKRNINIAFKIKELHFADNNELENKIDVANSTDTTEYSNTLKIIKEQFKDPLFKIVTSISKADYVINISSNTKQDENSTLLENQFGQYLVRSNVNIKLVDQKSKKTIYKSTLPKIYGYSSSFKEASIKAYSSIQLELRLREAIFFLKSKCLSM